MKLDPKRVAGAIEVPLLAAVEEITHSVAAEFQPDLWEVIRDGTCGQALLV